MNYEPYTLESFESICVKTSEIFKELSDMYSGYEFFYDVSVETLRIRIVAKSPFHYFRFNFHGDKSKASIIKRIQNTLNAVCVTYIMSADLCHEKELNNDEGRRN